jgi:hypothetical protein
MPVDTEALKDNLESFCSKFFSLIIACCLGVSNFVYLIGTLRLIFSLQRFKRLEVAHFLGLGFALSANVCYLVLHFIPKKKYSLMHVLTGLLLLSLFFTGLSMGVTGPTVDDCNDGIQEAEHNVEDSFRDLNLTTVRKGALGQSLGTCRDDTVIFAASILLNFFQIVALFDVQRLLLSRIRNKSVGERFVEMGLRY